MSVYARTRPAARALPHEATASAEWRPNVAWALAALTLVATLVFREFPEADGPSSWFHHAAFAGFKPADLFVLAFAWIAVLRWLARPAATLPRESVIATIVVAIPVLTGIWTGLAHGSTNLFSDWKNLVIGCIFAFALWATLLHTDEDVIRMARLMVLVSTGYSAFIIVRFALGGGVVTETLGRTPVFTGPVLVYMIAAVAVSAAMLAVQGSRPIWLTGAALPAAVVLLSLRRFAWGELATVIVLILAMHVETRGALRRLLPPIAALAAVFALLIATGGGIGVYAQRLASFDFLTRSSSRYAVTNQSHLDDILDGWDQVKRHPLFGLGVGVTFVGDRTRSWKPVSSQVHNGPLTVWIQFGLLGLVVFLGAHLKLFSAMRSRLRGQTAERAAITRAALAFAVAQFLVTCTITTWTYALWAESIVTFTLIAMVFARPGAAPR